MRHGYCVESKYVLRWSVVETMQNALIQPFIRAHKLPEAYVETAEKWFFPLVEALVLHQKEASRPLVIGVNGAQGSGKTTLADLLVFLLQQRYPVNAVSLSIDDFYLTRSERIALAQSVHPLFETRGVPGTHDLTLAMSTLNALVQGKPVAIPRFNKATDDRYDESKWYQCDKPVDFIILEGWCVGAMHQSYNQLQQAINTLEEQEDADLVWRGYINQQLFQPYAQLFKMIDQWVMLKAPHFDCIYHWRLEQEQKLREQHITHDAQGMSDELIRRFILFYQRFTEHMLETLPAKVNYLFELDEQRQIIYAEQQNKMNTRYPTQATLLIYSDMDGSLLNHNNYDFSAAMSALDLVGERGIPVIPCTSKTAAELMALRRRLENHSPFIIENGAAVYIPLGTFSAQPEGTVRQGRFWVKSFSQGRDHWLALVEQAKSRFGDCFTHFNQMTIDDIVEVTGLDKQSAQEASERQYGEPVLWLGSDEDKAEFIALLQQQGAEILEGGRFLHVSGETDKAKAMHWLTAIYQSHCLEGLTLKTLAVGDSDNDIAMLEAADVALIIRSPVHEVPTLQRTRDCYISDDIAPLGWKQGVEMILKKLDNAKEDHHG